MTQFSDTENDTRMVTHLSRFYKLYHCYFINCTGSILENVLILRKNTFRNKAVYSNGSENNLLCIWHKHLKCGNMVKTMQEFLLLVCNITKIQNQDGHGGSHL